MCGRYSISKKAREIGEHFNVTIPSGFQGELFNAAPAQSLPVIAMNQPLSIQMFQWGLKAPWKNASGESSLVINARSESLRAKKMFSRLLDGQRCIIPADGFFEWEKTRKIKQPWRFLLESEELFSFAGLFDLMETPDGCRYYAFSIITTQANSLLEGIHDRMPVILDQEGHAAWLRETSPSVLDDLLQPFPSEKMKHYKVSQKVNNAANNNPELIKPWQDPNLTLF
ncbi:MAG: SOS response-associated peptidase [Bacteroides sp.]|jgi:putative SOS response-associated peptidase YedK|nr:SOS response-associated peptidase [Bacteroides sp.]